jgi:hypothetical protein
VSLRVLAPGGVEYPDGSDQASADAPALMLGKAGTIPASPSADVADFLVVVPYNMTLDRLKATAKTAPVSTTTAQLRRSTNGGVSFSDFLGAVSIAAGDLVGSADPADADVSEGDVLQFSVTAGGGAGTNLMIQVIGRRR